MPEAGSIPVTPELVTTRCVSCQALIFFAETSSGARSPYDVHPRVDDPPRPLDPAQLAGEMPPGEGYVTHWKTCPTADTHRPPRVNPAQLHIVPEEAPDGP